MYNTYKISSGAQFLTFAYTIFFQKIDNRQIRATSFELKNIEFANPG